MSAGNSISEILSTIPPAMQLVIVGGLGLFTVVSWGGRLFPSWRWLWSRPDAHTRRHFIDYTLIPTLVFGAAAVTVWQGWDPALPLYGSWSPARFWGAIGLLCGALGSLLTAQHLARITDLAEANARRLTSWLPLLLTLTGIGLMIAFVWSVLD